MREREREVGRRASKAREVGLLPRSLAADERVKRRETHMMKAERIRETVIMRVGSDGRRTACTACSSSVLLVFASMMMMMLICMIRTTCASVRHDADSSLAICSVCKRASDRQTESAHPMQQISLIGKRGRERKTERALEQEHALPSRTS